MTKRVDLTAYQCPELFVRFKLSLRDNTPPIAFVITAKPVTNGDDIRRYLDKVQAQYAIEQNDKTITFSVESLARV